MPHTPRHEYAKLSVLDVDISGGQRQLADVLGPFLDVGEIATITPAYVHVQVHFSSCILRENPSWTLGNGQGPKQIGSEPIFIGQPLWGSPADSRLTANIHGGFRLACLTESRVSSASYQCT